MREGLRREALWDRKSILTGFGWAVNKPWKSAAWFVEKRLRRSCSIEDVKLKAELREKLKAAGVSSIEIERPGNKLRHHDPHGTSGHRYRPQRR